MERAISVAQLFSTKRKLLDFDGKWLEAIGRPELKGSWIIHGPSGNGKTAFAIQLAVYLTKWARVFYNSLEEGDSASLTAAFRRQRVENVRRKIIVLNKESIANLKIRLKKKKAPRVVILDSAQYTFISVLEYFELIKEFPNTLFIWISHEKNKEPKGTLAENIYYDAFVKIRVAGYRATIRVSRYIEEESRPIDVWPEGAARFHNEF